MLDLPGNSKHNNLCKYLSILWKMGVNIIRGLDMKPFTGTPTDYSIKKNWLALPEITDKSADLIFLYPSSCHDKKAGVICPVDNKSMKRSAKHNFAQQMRSLIPNAELS